ncbi:protein piccolo-like isoform X2 [Amphibalanus amphitrite]|uniref:protein piccolo-like isoform X2 n=1 Tax=Amphibalanus amphitrite TaxID=1232801 RepID=UPI001C8FEFA7|nr:protein piccolo-like isoform X2 [Amphibalanus amphitrite]
MSKIPVRGVRAGGSGLPRLATRLPRPSASLTSTAPPPPPSAIPTAIPSSASLRAAAEAPPPDLKPGDPVLVDGEPGTLRFLGHTLFADGLWAGVELARGIGKNDGSVGGRRYFFCQRGHGLFAPVSRVVRYDPEPPSPSPPPEPQMTPEPEVTSARRREDLTLPVSSTPRIAASGGSKSPSASASAAGAAALSPAGDLWWDNTEGSVGDQLDDVELLQDMELDELSLGILTPDQMDDDSHLLLRPDELNRSLELLTSPDPDMAPSECAFNVSAPAERMRLISDEGAPLNVTVTIGREPDWEDEFDAAPAATAAEPALSQPKQRDSEPAEPAKVTEHPEQPAESAESATPGSSTISPESVVSGTNHSESDTTFIVTDSSADVTMPVDVTASMSSESSDVTLKDESNGAGEALAEPPSPDTETLVLARPQAELVADVGATALVKPVTVVTDVSGGDVVCAVTDKVQVDLRERKMEMDVQQEPQEMEGQQGLHDTRPDTSVSPVLERKKESAPGQERKSVVFSEPEAEVRLAAEPSETPEDLGPTSTQVTDQVTSCATSTTSIDGGYQGDSEFDTGTPNEDPTRPPPRLDVLTDSDFCSEGAAGTESEAEHRLTDDMESSGVYSDAESRRSVEPDREPIEAIEETEETTLTPVRESASELEFPPSAESTPSAAAATATSAAPATAAAAAATPEPTPPARRRDPIPSHVVRAREPPPKKEPIKMNHPLPRRNVQSKLRSMLESPSPAAEAAAARRPARPARKGRWDAVMNRIEQNKSEEKTRPRREVKSRLYEGVTPAKGTQNGSRKSLSGRNSRTGSTHTLTGSRTSLRPAGSGSRSVSPTLSEVSTASSAGSAGSRGSMHSRDSAKLAAKSRTGSVLSLVSERAAVSIRRKIPTGSAPTTSRSGSKQPSAASRAVSTTATRAALEAPSRRAAPLSNKTNIANNQGTKTTKPSTRPPIGGRSQNKVQSKASTKDAKPVPIKVGPAAAAAAAAAAARHEVQVNQLEDQLAGHQRDLAAARGDLQHASRCFDAAMVMVNYLSNEYNPFQLTDEVKALQSRATELQLALDEAAATQRRLEESIEDRERARLQREEEVGAELRALSATHQEELDSGKQKLEEVRSAWHQERQLLEQDLVRQQEARDQDVRELSRQHQETLASVTAQWERELAESQRRSQAEADQLRQQISQLEEANSELSRRECELKAAIGQSSNTKIQVLSARIKKQEEDIKSLNAVLELKSEEIAKLRQDEQELARLREKVPRLEERCDKHRAKAEDLEAQLRQRELVHRQLSEENRRLQEYQDRESKANKRLSMENEQLQYKLRNHSQSELMQQSTPGVLSRSASFRSARTPTFIARAYSESPHITRVSPRSPLKSDPVRRRSRRSEPDDGSPPQVTAIVEKSDSISWVLDLESSGRGSSAEPDEAGDSLDSLRLGGRGVSRSPPSASGASHGGSESSDSEEADRDADRDGVFYQLAGPRSAPVAINGGGPASLPIEHMRKIPESSEGTEI